VKLDLDNLDFHLLLPLIQRWHSHFSLLIGLALRATRMNDGKCEFMRARFGVVYRSTVAPWVAVLSLLFRGGGALAANVELDPPSIPAGYIALLLINEVPFPGERGYVSEEDTKMGMLSVLWVLHCRATAIPPGYTQKQVAAVETRNVIDIMTAGGVKGQVDGFYQDTDGRPVAVARVHERVAYLVGIANRGQPGKAARLLSHARDLARQYFQAGPAGKDLFADLRKIGTKPVTGHGYAWMTDVRGCDPGGSFVRVPDADQGSLGGNRFYTLELKK
jgi:hypothetical protein